MSETFLASLYIAQAWLHYRLFSVRTTVVDDIKPVLP